MTKYIHAMNTTQQCSVAWLQQGMRASYPLPLTLYQGMRASYPLPLTINQITLYLFAHELVFLTIKNLLKSNCFKRDLKELKLGAVTITSESEFQARVTRLVKKIDHTLILLGCSLTLQLLFFRVLELFIIKQPVKTSVE